MKASRFIPKAEFDLLLITALITLICSFGSLWTYQIKAYNAQTVYFEEQQKNLANNEPSFSGPYCFPDRHPQFLKLNILFIGLGFITICFEKRFVFSTILTAASVGRFAFWYFETQNDYASSEILNFDPLNLVLYKSNIFDYIVLSFLSILFFWQITILLRMLIGTTKRNYKLP